MDAGVKALYLTAAQPMRRFFVYQGTSGDEADDVLQETFVKIVRSAESFSGKGAAKAWIWQIARNCLTDHLRKQAARTRLTDDLRVEAGVAGHEPAVNEEQWIDAAETMAAPVAASVEAGASVDECVSAGLESFSRREPDRAYALSMQMDGLSIDEIGQRIGRTMAATKEYLSQCRKKIQPFIAHCTELLAN